MLLKQILFISFFLIASVSLFGNHTSTSKHPNIIIFYIDDMGWQDCSLPFWDKVTELNRRYHTPNMVQLAKEGMKFTNAYSNAVCTPSRISMMTGINAAHHRVTNWTSPYNDRATDHQDDILSPPEWNINGLSPRAGISNTIHATPLPQLLMNAGYFTIHIGKAHWGSAGTPGSNPYNLGFMVNISGNSIGHPQSYYGEQNYGNLPSGKTTINAVPDLSQYYGSNTFLTEALTLEALKSLDAPIRSKQPFFLHFSHYAIHTPIQGDKRFVQKYFEAGLDSVEANYASLIEGMDKSLGDIMSFLKMKNIDQNTILIFMSDNGGLSLTPLRSGVKHSHNLPLRAGKGSLYEGGIRVPMIVKWPGKAKPASSTSQYIQVEDFFPSILEIASISNSKFIQKVDGKSFVPILKNGNFNDSSRALIWHYPNRWTSDEKEAQCFSSAIRQGDWKLLYLMKENKLELYNLKTDIGEKNNLASVHPEKTKALAQLLTQKLKGWHALMPRYILDDKQISWPEELIR